MINSMSLQMLSNVLTILTTFEME